MSHFNQLLSFISMTVLLFSRPIRTFQLRSLEKSIAHLSPRSLTTSRGSTYHPTSTLSKRSTTSQTKNLHNTYSRNANGESRNLFSTLANEEDLVDDHPMTLDDNDSSLKVDPSLPYFPIYYNDVYKVNLPPNHRFPMQKYQLVREMVQAKLNSLSEEERSRVQCEFRVSPLTSTKDLITTHSPSYVNNFLKGNQTENELRNVGFPWSESGVKRALSSVGGTVAAATSVCTELRNRRRRRQRRRNSSPNKRTAPIWSAHIAGGTHHAFEDYGEGFCVFSDIAVAANVILRNYPDIIRRILIIDLDVHQGNGNAVLFRNNPNVFTFSMHCQGNYFSQKETSDLDIELPIDCEDQTYLITLRHWLKRLSKDRDRYDLIFFQAGVDVLEDDRLGRMKISPMALKRRNEMVFEFAKEVEKGLVITMGGGYPQKEWDPIIEGHAGVYLGAHEFLGRLRYDTESELVRTPW